MGSLMSGWDSPAVDPKVAKYERNRSLTRGEIDAYWKSKRQREEEGGTQSLPTTPTVHRLKENPQTEAIKKETRKRYTRCLSMPLPDRSSSLLLDDVDRKQIRLDAACEPAVEPAAGCWWTTSSWAFLNEPPVIAESNGQARRPYVQYSSSSKFCATQYANPKMDDASHHQISTQ